MKFSTRSDLSCAIDPAFEAASDFGLFQSLATRRGVAMSGLGKPTHMEMGQTWESAFEYRGKRRSVLAEVIACDPGQGYAIAFIGEGVEATGVVDFLALSKARTRMFVSLDMRPTTIASRVVLQSLKFAKKSLSAKFKTRVDAFAGLIEERARGSRTQGRSGAEG